MQKLLFNSKFKQFSWHIFYDLLCWWCPNRKIRCLNYGYAIISKDGKMIKNLTANEEEERF